HVLLNDQFVKPKTQESLVKPGRISMNNSSFSSPNASVYFSSVKEPTGVRSVMNDRQELRILRRQINKASFCVTSYLG
ncbi:hypothetical protein CEXT_484271, partial [Caerostris extrusa]